MISAQPLAVEQGALTASSESITQTHNHTNYEYMKGDTKCRKWGDSG